MDLRLSLVEVAQDLLFLAALPVPDRHHELPLRGLHHHRLPVDPPDHVERPPRLAAQGQLHQVVLDAALDHLAQVAADLEEAVCRAHAPDTLVRAPVVVVLHPQRDPLLRLLEAVELRAPEELVVDVLPEPLDLAERHRVVRPRADVLHPVLAQLLLEPRRPAPRGVLPAVVRQHLARRAELADPAAVRLQDVLGGLAAEHPERDDEPRVVVDEADQVGVLAAEPEREDVRLPHLVRRRALEEARLVRHLRGARGPAFDEPLRAQRAPHGLGAPGQVQDPPEELRDLRDAPRRLGALGVGHRALHPGGDLLPPGAARVAGVEAGLAARPVPREPAVQGVLRDAGLRGDLAHGDALLRVQLHQPQAEVERVVRAHRPAVRETLLPLACGSRARAPASGR